ncbi:MAG: 6-carboxytetrahydropterin synthase [Verrucomicrobia bacterium]|nr:6-carboxytetrahydropterin synthase [Verrucomicrobiota bacterium]
MFTVTKTIDFCYGHRLLNYEGKCRHLHGHNGRLEVDIALPSLDNRGMVQDFSEIKQALKGWVDATLDHRMLLWKEDPMVPVLRERGEVLVTLDFNPTAENLAKMVFEYASGRGLPVREVRLWETPSSCASYRAEP